MCQSASLQTHKHTFALPLSDSILVFSGFFSTSLSLSACCLFIRQTICWSCVFFSACRPLGTLLHMAVLYQLSDARGTPSVGHCPLHRHEICVFTSGSLPACCRIMGRMRESRPFNSPHHWFGELISSFLWPAIIYSPVYFMAHFKISPSLYVQANLHLQRCLYWVISVVFLCSVPCKTLRLELWAVVITLIPRCFIV